MLPAGGAGSLLSRRVDHRVLQARRYSRCRCRVDAITGIESAIATEREHDMATALGFFLLGLLLLALGGDSIV
jgi:hypothetical protein